MAETKTEPEVDRDGMVTIHHVGIKGEARCKPISVERWVARGWAVGPLSPQAKAAAQRQQ